MNTPNAPSLASTMSFFEMLDRTFRVYRQHFSRYVTLTASILIPIAVVQLLINIANLSSLTSFSTTGRTSAASASALSSVCGATGILLLLSIIQVVLINGSITYLASENYLGRNPPIGEALRATINRSRSLGCGYLIFFALIVAFGFVIGFVAALCNPLLAAAGLLVYLGIATYAFLAPVLVLENVSVSHGVNRAWTLGKARFWTAFWLIAIIVIINYVISIAFTGVAEVISLTVLRSNSQVLYTVINLTFTTATEVFITPILPIGLTLLYHDTRNRLEGLDFTLQALGKSDARPSDVVSPDAQPGLNSRDLVNVGIIVGVSIVLALIASSFIQSFVNSFVPNLPAR